MIPHFLRFMGWLWGRLVHARGPRKRRLIILLIGFALLVGTQRPYFERELPAPTSHRVTASTGVADEYRFFFYLRRMNIFPLAAMPDGPAVDSVQEGERLLREDPMRLYMEVHTTFAPGDWGRTYLYFVDHWLLKSPATKPSLMPANALGFLLALLVCFGSFWWHGHGWLGLALTLVFANNPFQLFAVYGQENVFCWAITAMLLSLAITFPLLLSERRSLRHVALLTCALGLLLAAIRTVRSEPAVVLGGVLVVLLCAQRVRWRDRLIGAALLLSTFVCSGKLFTRYFHNKHRSTQALLAERGGVPYAGPLSDYHEFWHPVSCGLGDFDKKYGYEWDDRKTYAYVYNELARRNGGIAPDGFQLDLDQKRFYDAYERYKVYPWEYPAYHEIVRDKVLGDIAHDPLWYFNILKQRVNRILRETTPISIGSGDWRLNIQSDFFGLAAVPLLMWLLVKRDYFRAKLLIFSAPLSLNAFLVFSGFGMTNYTTFHIFSAVLLLERLVRGLRGKRLGAGGIS